MKPIQTILLLAAAVALFASGTARASVPYPPLFSPNTGEVLQPTDDPALSVDLINGLLQLELADLIVFHTDADLNLSFGLHYSSGNPAGGTLGPGWRHTWEVAVSYAYNGGSPTLAVSDPLGRVTPFVQSVGTWVSLPSMGCYLTAVVLGSLQNPTGFTISDRWGRTLSFDAAGLLQTVSDYFGRSTTLTWSGGFVTGIADAFGSSLSLNYTAGLLTTVQDNTMAGAPVYLTLNYDVTGRLASAVLGVPGGLTATHSFTYGGATSLLDSWTDPDSGVHAFTYTGGLVTRIMDPLASSVAIGYGTNSATVTDRTGAIWGYSFSPTVKAMTQLAHPAIGGVIYNTVQGFSAGRNLASRTEPGGSTWAMSYDTSGNMLSRSTAYSWAGAPETIVHQWSYNALNLMQTYTDPRGGVWYFDWLGAGRLARIIRPDDNPASPTHPALFTWDLTGFPASRTDFGGGTWSFVYSGGLPASVTSPLANTTSYTWSNRGLPLTETSPLGNTITWTYDGLYRAATETRPFDATGGATTSYAFTAYGRLASVLDPVLALWSWTRDAAGRVVQETDPMANSRPFGYDGEGRMISWTDFRGNSFSAAHDAWGRITSLTDAAAATATWSYAFGPTSITHGDRTGVVSIRVFDPAGRLRSEADGLGNTTAFTVDGCDNITAVTDPRGFVTTRSYDPLNQLIAQTDPLSFVLSMSYDLDGNIATLTNRVGGTWAFARDLEGRLTTLTNPDSTTRQFAWNADGKLTSFTNELGGVMSIAYNAGGYQTSVTTPTGNAMAFTWDKTGRLATESDSISAIRALTRDALGRITAIAYPDSSFESFSYDPDGNMVSHSDRRGSVWSYSYDHNDRPTFAQNPRGGTSLMGYDAEGRLVSRLDPALAPYQWAYNARGFLASYGFPGQLMTWSYDASGNTTTVTDAMGSVWQYTYNGRNEQITATDPLAATTATLYDAEGNIAAITDPRGSTTLWQYDSMSRRQQVTDPLGNIESYAWISDFMTTRTDRNGRTMTYTPDSEFRLAGESYFDPFAPANTLIRSFTRDARGRITGESCPYLSIERSFDNCDRITGETWAIAGMPGPARTASYTHDANSNLTGITDFSGRVITYTYDALDYCTQINDGGQISTFSYDLCGRMTSRVLPSGQYELFSHIPGSTLVGSHAVYDSLGNLQDSTAWSYDFAWNPVTKTSMRGWTVNYTHDAAHRLTAEVRTGLGAYTRTYGYDPAGNMAIQTVNGTTTTYAVDARNNTTSETTNGITTSYTYDGNGDLTADSTGRTWLYDHAGRLAEYASGTGQSWRYYSAFDDMRIRRDTRVNGTPVYHDLWFWEDSGRLNEFGCIPGGPAALASSWSYTAEHDLHALTVPSGPGSGYFPYLLDMEDNVVALVDTAQVFRNTYEYSAYGTTVTTGGLAPVANSYLYKTTPMDPESGMYSAFRRMYDPAFNRYTGTGPYDQLDYGTPAFALGRPHILRPENGIAHGYTTLLDEPMPLPTGFQLPGLELMQPGILSTQLVQWGYGVTICHRTGQELSCAGLDGFPSTPAELAGKVNGFAELALRLERPQPSVLKREYPVRPDSVDRGSDE